MSEQDIRVGDLVRATHKEYPETIMEGRVTGTDRVSVAIHPMVYLDHDFWHFEVLDRPLPSFEWGTVIGDPDDVYRRAVYLPKKADDLSPWIANYGAWQSNEWARARLAGGWQVIEPPEDTDE